MKSFILVAVFAIASVNARAAVQEEAGAETSRPAPWYDCSGKQPGNYVNPRDCTRFITCDAGLQPIERDCGECSNRPEACTPQNRLVYNSTVDACLWADETECHDGGDSGESSESSESGESGESSEGPGTDGPGTEGPGSSEEGSGESEERPPKAGEPCDPEDCENTGYCQTYLRCDKDSKTWVEEQCGDELFWNTKNGAIHGGNCDFLDNLDQEDVDRLRADPECLACFWEADGECSASYKYQAPDLRNRNVLNLSCSSGLIFSQEKETCQRCEDVKRDDGRSCC